MFHVFCSGFAQVFQYLATQFFRLGNFHFRAMFENIHNQFA